MGILSTQKLGVQVNDGYETTVRFNSTTQRPGPARLLNCDLYRGQSDGDVVGELEHLVEPGHQE